MSLSIYADNSMRIVWVLDGDKRLASFSYEMWGGLAGASRAADLHVRDLKAQMLDPKRAPMDGSPFLGYLNFGSESSWCVIASCQGGWLEYVTDGGRFATEQLIAWQPLPPTPQPLS